jgi:hypothetical protein
MDPGRNALASPFAATFGGGGAPKFGGGDGGMALWQRAPKPSDCDPFVGTAVSFTDGFIQIGMCDGSTRNLRTDTSQTLWQSMHFYGSGRFIGESRD